ncbi:MAG: beta-lactamase family protein [Candidatus Eremiobacteraeota bacterium]|nr:beta-lactamase family protein [Candidatus Eremiobacteraeota bacterium]
MHRPAIAAFLTCLLLAGSPARSDSPETRPIDTEIVAAMRAAHVPGLSIAVVKNGSVVLMRGYGLADVEQGVPANAQTVYQTGSIGKQFTALLVLMLAERGILHLDDPIVKYLGAPNPAWRAITIRELLTHTSGISNSALDKAQLTLDYTNDQILKMIASYPLDFPPGTRWSYSNCGYELLGFIVQKATGRFYGDLLAEYVWKPLGMHATRIIDLAGIVPHRAPGYVLTRDRKLANQYWVSQSWDSTADGAMLTTVEDMTKWDRALDGQQLISAASYRQMYTPVRLKNGKTHPYGFGWDLETYRGGRVYSHGGVWQGFTGFNIRYVDAHVDVVVFTNLGENDAAEAIARRTARYYLEGR